MTALLTDKEKAGNLPAAAIILWTGILLLMWAFGSYLIYILTSPDAPVCFPPLSGCAAISKAGTSGEIASIFYRATVLPATTFLALSNYFVLQYLAALNGVARPATQKIGFAIGVVLTPLCLAMAEAILNGVSTSGGFEQLHILFSGLAFLGVIAFEILIAYQLFKFAPSVFSKLLLGLSVGALLFGVIGSLVLKQPGASNIVEWNVFILAALWLVAMGAGLGYLRVTQQRKVQAGLPI